MKSELWLGMSAAAALPIARFSSAAMKRRASYARFSMPEATTAPPWTRFSSLRSHRSLRSLRMVCGVTSKRAARSSTLTRPAARASARISFCRWLKSCIRSPCAQEASTPPQ
jgi:hypothetical protein